MVDFKALMDRAKKEGSIQNLTPNFVKWEKAGQQIVGEFIDKNDIDSSLNEGHYKQYLFRTDDGLVKFAMGSAADAELDATMVRGGFYEITYQGQEALKGGKRVNKFQVFCFGSKDEVFDEPFAPGETRNEEKSDDGKVNKK